MSRRLFFARLLLLSLFITVPGLAAAKGLLELPSIFSDGMVLQRDKPLRLWGRCTPDTEVTVTFAGQSKTVGSGEGKWMVTLEPLDAHATGRPLTVTAGNETLTVKDILVGDVWLCGGQSNMEWRLAGTRDADLEIPAARFPGIRFFRIEPEGLPEPREDLPVVNDAGQWRTCTPESAGDCSAVAFHFGKRLHRHLDVPIGLINAAWGGTMAQHWVTRETLETLPLMKDSLAAYETKRSEWIKAGGEEGARRRYEADLAKWEKEAAEAKARNERPPGRPNPQSYADPATAGRIPAGPLNAMIMPLAGLSIKGALFYQGENNSFGDTWIPFQETFPAVISDWRNLFQDQQLPFGIIQIAGWSTRRTMTYDMNHHTNVVREIQFLTWQKTPGTGLIVSFDANSDANIHPRRKGPVGDRSARWALSEVYGAKQSNGTPLEWQGPVYQAMEIVDGKVKVTFKKDSAQGLRLDKSDARGFYIAGEDRVFHHADARVVSTGGEAPAIEVWSPEVNQPVAVRYAVSNLPLGSLMNGRELPAYPFRTDTWPLQPHRGTELFQVGE